jgi:uncharacterized DUF497 family protein
MHNVHTVGTWISSLTLPRRRGNLRKHGVSFADAEGVFMDPLALHRIGEERFVAIGAGSAGHLLVVVYTLRGEAIRLISARRATPVEIRAYES